jgi:hypothetical protein
MGVIRVKARCVMRFRYGGFLGDTATEVVGYCIETEDRKIYYFYPEELKQLVKSKKLDIVNLKLGMDGSFRYTDHQSQINEMSRLVKAYGKGSSEFSSAYRETSMSFYQFEQLYNVLTSTPIILRQYPTEKSRSIKKGRVEFKKVNDEYAAYNFPAITIGFNLSYKVKIWLGYDVDKGVCVGAIEAQNHKQVNQAYVVGNIQDIIQMLNSIFVNQINC